MQKASPSDALRPAPAPAPVNLRAARDDDAEGLIALIGGCFAEYPGCVLDVDGEIPELRAIASWAEAEGGAFWVGEDAASGDIVACGGVKPAGPPGQWELVKLYVRADRRGQGLASRLIDRIVGHARTAGARRLILWTDTRFTTAHRVYDRRGFVKQAETRALADKSDTVEYHFIRELEPA